MKVENVKLRLTCGQYQFMEMELPDIRSLEDAEKLCELIAKNEVAGQEMVLKPIHYTNCDHPFQAYKEMSGVTAKGHWTGIKCQKCGSVKFNGGEWKPPRSEELQIGGEK